MPLITFVGMRFRNNYRFATDDNQKISYEFEPDNKYDPNAIKV